MPEDANNPVNPPVQPDIDQAGVNPSTPQPERRPASQQLVIVEPLRSARKVMIVKARRVSSLHETVAVTFALGGLIVGYLAWRLSEGTISISAAAPLVESELEKIVGGETKIGTLRLGWNQARRDFVVTASDITATTDARTSPLALGQVNLTLNARSLLTGQAQITSAQLSGLNAVLVLDKQGRTAFGFGTPDEVLQLPRSTAQRRSLRAILAPLRQVVMRDGAGGRVEAITLAGATLIVIDPDTGERLTLANARASVTTNAANIVTMQAAGFAQEMGGFGNIAISTSPDNSQKLAIVAVVDQTRLAKLPSSLRVGPLARLSGDTAPISGKVFVELGDEPSSFVVRSTVKLGAGRFQGVDLSQASGTLMWDGPSGKVSIANVAATAAQGSLSGGNGNLTMLANGQRTLAVDIQSLAFADPQMGRVNGTQVQANARLRSDFSPVSGVIKGARLNVSRDLVGSLQMAGFEASVASTRTRQSEQFAVNLKTKSLSGDIEGRNVSGTGVDAQIQAVRSNNRFAPTSISATANRIASSLVTNATAQVASATNIFITAGTFDGRNHNMPANLSFRASAVDLPRVQGAPLSGQFSGVAIDAAGFGTPSLRTTGTIGNLNALVSGARTVSATGRGLVFSAAQITPTSARVDQFTANTLNVDVNGVSVGTLGLSATGTFRTKTFADATIASNRVEINHATQLVRPFWAENLRLRGDIGARSMALDAFSLQHRGVGLSGELDLALASRGSPRVDLIANVAGRFSVETLLSAWPRRFLPETRGSITRLVPYGSAAVSRLMLAIPAGMLPKQILPRSAMDLAFDLQDVTVTYLPGMSAITNVSGQGVLRGNSLLLNLDRGGINDIALSDGVVEIAEFKPQGAIASIRTRVDGRALDMAREIDLPPLAILSKARLDVDRISGVGSVTLDLLVPLKPALRPGDIGVSVNGDFEDAGLTRVFAGLDATQASVHLTVNNDDIKLAGKASVLGNVFDFTWANVSVQDAPPQTTLNATGQLSIDDLLAIGLDVGGYATGPVDLNITSNSQGSQFGAAVINANLVNTSIRLPGELWLKPEGVAATASANLYSREGGGWNVQDLRFDSPGALLRGAFDLSDDAKLVDARFSRVVIANAGDLAVSVTPAATGLTVTLRGEYLNLTPFLQTKNVSEQAVDLFDRPLNLSADIQRVSTSAQNSLTNVHADIVRDLNGWRTLSATGDSPAGSSQIRLMVERDGRRSISGILSDAGFFAQLLYPGAPVLGGSGVIEGELPVVGANSSGILTFTGKNINLTRPGTAPILFENVQLPMSVRGGVVTLRDGQADGDAYTVKASGYVDVGAGRLDFRGVATPGGLNRVLADIPLFGAILGGGADEGLLGITFAAKGPMTAPRISINPVSALAPGFLRKLFESEAPLSPQPRLVVTTLAGDPIVTTWPYGPSEDMSEASVHASLGASIGPDQ